jgi:hypothetical protein
VKDSITNFYGQYYYSWLFSSKNTASRVMSIDTLKVQNNIIIKTKDTVINNLDISGHLFQNNKISIIPELINKNYTEWFVIFFIFLLFLLSLIWFFFPERIKKIITTENGKNINIGNTAFSNPGIIIYILLLLTITTSTTVIVYFIIKSFFRTLIPHDMPVNKLIIIIMSAVIIYYFIRFVIIYMSGFLFNTMYLSKELLKSYFKTDIIEGLILIPVVFLIYFSSGVISVYIGLFIIAAVIIYKWLQIFFVGMSYSKVTIFHNILYLCTLEIVPVFVLIKILDFYQKAGM